MLHDTIDHEYGVPWAINGAIALLFLSCLFMLPGTSVLDNIANRRPPGSSGDRDSLVGAAVLVGCGLVLLLIGAIRDRGWRWEIIAATYCPVVALGLWSLGGGKTASFLAGGVMMAVGIVLALAGASRSREGWSVAVALILATLFAILSFCGGFLLMMGPFLLGDP